MIAKIVFKKHFIEMRQTYETFEPSGKITGASKFQFTSHKIFL